MPTYEYRCVRCGHQFEAVHGVGGTVERCEQCGGPVRRIFSPPALIFKGSGFHVTDYRKSPPPSEGDGKAAAKPTTDGKSPASTPSEPASSGSSGGGGPAAPASDSKKAS